MFTADFINVIYILLVIQIFPSQFELLLAQHRSSTISLRIGLQQWPIMVTDHSFGDGWDVFCEHNSIKRHDMLLLRHAGSLIFDIIHFSELQIQAYMRWTAPLPNLLQTSYSPLQGSNTILLIIYSNIYNILLLFRFMLRNYCE